MSGYTDGIITKHSILKAGAAFIEKDRLRFDWPHVCIYINMRLFVFLLLVASGTYAADVCNPANLIGPYTFQLSGTTTISGASKPATSLARVVFDGNGNVSGTASSMFEGFLLGNPVTGTYTAKPDCTVS